MDERQPIAARDYRNFLETEYLRLCDEQFRLKRLAIAAAGVIIPTIIAVLYSKQSDASFDTKTNVMIVLLMFTSILYLSLALSYSHTGL